MSSKYGQFTNGMHITTDAITTDSKFYDREGRACQAGPLDTGSGSQLTLQEQGMKDGLDAEA